MKIKPIHLYILVPIALFIVYKIYASPKKSNLDPKVADPDLHDKFNFDIIPDGKGNYRSAQFTEKELPYVIKKYNIKNIIRMNADDSDSKHKSNFPETPRSVEKKICEDLGCTYQFINSHEGYRVGQGYTQSIDKTDNILKKGNTLIHCAHGADRTGGMVASYLKNNNILTDKKKLWNYTTKYNRWKSMLKNGTFFGSGYDKYADGFYPISQLKNDKNELL
jgi:hypothetical protein